MSELKKQVEQMVDEILSTPKAEEKVEKAMPSDVPANGGEDKIKSGSPLAEEQKLMGDEKKEEAKKAEAEDDEEKKDKKEDKKEDEAKKSEDKEDEEKEEAKKAKKMKKSLAELAEHLEADEIELIKAWREEPQEEITKSQPEEQTQEPKEDLKKALAEAIEPLRKALEEKDALVKSLTEKVEKMASQPAYDRRSIDKLETIEKSGATPQSSDISKAQVLDAMLDLQKAGKGVTSHHVAEFEATKNISNPQVRELVFKKLNVK